jgi:hypothetical protein
MDNLIQEKLQRLAELNLQNFQEPGIELATNSSLFPKKSPPTINPWLHGFLRQESL